MATLEAIVSVKDNASSKFTTMRANAQRFERQLEGVNRELDKIGIKLAALTSKKWTINLDYDRNLMGRAMGGGGLNPNAGMFGPQLALPATPNPGGNNSGGDVSRAVRSRIDADREKRVSLGRGFGGLGSGGGAFRFISRSLLPLAFSVGSSVGSTLGKGMADSLGNVLAKSAKGAELAGKLAPMFTKLGGGIGSLVAIAAVAVPGVTALTMALTVLGTLLFSLAVPIAALIPAITALGGAFAFVGLPMFMMFSQTKQLVDQKKKLREELEQLTPGTEQYNQKLKELNKTEEELRKNGGAVVWERATKVFEELKSAVFNDRNNKVFVDILDNIITALKPLIPIISEAVYQFSIIFRDLFAELGVFMQSAEGDSFFKRLFGKDTLGLVRTLAQGVGWLVRLFGELSIAIAPVANVLFKKLNGWMEDLSGRLKSGESDLGGWLSDMMPVFTGAMSAIGAAVKGLANFFAEPAIKKYTTDFIQWFKDLIPQAIAFFRETIVKYGPVTIKIFQLIGNVIRVIWTLLTKIIEPFLPFTELGYDILNIFLRMQNALMELSPLGEKVRDAFELAIWPFKKIWEFVEKIVEKLENNSLYKLISGIAGVFTGPSEEEREQAVNWAKSRSGGNTLNPMTGTVVNNFTGANNFHGAQTPQQLATGVKQRTANMPWGPGPSGGTQSVWGG